LKEERNKRESKGQKERYQTAISKPKWEKVARRDLTKNGAFSY
jgi:hypothetical protein